MKVLYHHRTRGADAQGVHIRALTDALRALGHQVHMVALARQQQDGAPRRSSTGGGGPSLLGRAIPHWLYELMALAYNIPAFFVLTAAVLRHRPGLIYERYALFNVSGLWVARLFGIPFMLEVNAPLSMEHREHGDLVLHRLAERIEDRLCTRATRTVVVSSAMARIFEERGVPAERLLVMPNGVDRSRFYPEVDGSGVRQDNGLEDAFVIGFVGWIRPWHGVDRLVDAVARLAPELPQLRLLLVGDGPALPDLRDQVAALGMEDRVCFTGAVGAETIPAHIAAMDVAVQPDVTDYASPIKLFEYLALARPVIAPAKPNITEVVEDDVSALLFEPGSTDALADAIRRLYEGPELCNRLAARGGALIDERGYDWRANAGRVIDVVEGADPLERAA
jgi:glycosyltransferase involved in cell wall biosynthesis